MLRFIFLGVLLIGLLSSNVFAWDVKPMSKNVKQGERSYQLKISNKDGKTPVAVRLKAVLRDTNNLGDDKLSPTKDILVFPKQMIVKPGKVGIARVSIRKPNLKNIEKAYRIIVDQVPVRKADEKRGIKVLTRYLTSIYLDPKGKKVDGFEFIGGVVEKNSVSISAKNSGNTHQVILPSKVVITKNDNTKVEIDKKFEIVNILPNKEIDIVLPISGDSLNSAKSISFTNSCKTCNNQNYEVSLSK